MSASDTAMALLLRAMRLQRPFLSADAADRHIAKRARHPAKASPPASLQRTHEITVQTFTGCPVYAVSPGDTAKEGDTVGAVVYLHGGAWVDEISSQQWNLIGHLATDARTVVLVPLYQLLPDGTALAAHDLVVSLVLSARATHGPTCLAGDSAGGQVAFSAALTLLHEHQVVLPRLTLISPVLDASLSNPEIAQVQPRDPVLAVPGLRRFGERWSDELDLSDPRVSPLYGNFNGLGPLTIFTGTRDILNPDAHKARDKAVAAGVDVDFREAPGQFHVYPLLPSAAGREAQTVCIEQTKAAIAESREQ